MANQMRDAGGSMDDGTGESPAPVTKPAWSEALMHLTQASGLTQAEVARRAGLQRDAYSRYITSKTRPPLRKVIVLAQALGVKPSEIDPDRPHLDEDATASAPSIPGDAVAGATRVCRLTLMRGEDSPLAFLEVAAELPLTVAQWIVEILAHEGAA